MKHGQGSDAFTCRRAAGRERKRPPQAEHGDDRDDAQRDDAVEAIDLKDVFLDAGQVERKSEAKHGRSGDEDPPLGQDERTQNQEAGNADGGNRNVEDLSKRAVVDHAAIPGFVDRARLGAGGIVDAQRQG